MNKLFSQFAVLVVLFTFAASAIAADDPNKPGPVFGTQEACQVALDFGSYDVYEPGYSGNRDKDKRKGIKYDVLELEFTQCRFQRTLQAWGWTINPRGTKVRAVYDGSDMPRIYARDDCGNADNTPMPEAPPSPPPAIAPQAPAPAAPAITPQPAPATATAPAAPAPTPTPPATATATAEVNVHIDLPELPEDSRAHRREPIPDDDDDRPRRMSRRMKVGIGAVAAGVATGTYFLGRYLCWW